MTNHVKAVHEHLRQGEEALRYALQEAEGQDYPHAHVLKGAHYHLKNALSQFEHLPAEEFEEKPEEPKQEKPDGAGSRPSRGH